MQVAAEAGIEAEKAIDPERGEKKRNRQPGRVNRQQQDSFENRVLRARQQKDSGQDGADARGPAKGEGKADEEGSERTGAAFEAVQTLVRIERVDLEESGEMQSEDDDDNAGKDRPADDDTAG